MGISPVQDTIIVTGADSKFFLMACLLYQSIRQTSVAPNFFVLDFGLNENEKSFFRAKGILVEAPGGMGDAHPWAQKAMLYHYLPRPASNVIWIDSDILVGKGFGTALHAVLDDMAHRQIAVAASPEMQTGEFLSRFSNLNIWPFIRALTERKIPLQTDYYNSGFIIFRSAEILNEWGALAKSTPFHALFDQNIFNLVIQGSAVLALPRRIWNFHAGDFDQEFSGEMPLVLHVTSHRPDRNYKVHACRFARVKAGGYELRLLNARHFLDYQFQILEQFLASERAALAACGLVPADWPREKFAIAWNIAGDQPCPCQSGKPYQACHGAP